MKWHLTRDLVLFVAGLAGIAYETVVENADRPYLLVLFAAMVGLPAFLYRDETRNGKRKPPLPRIVWDPDDEESS